MHYTAWPPPVCAGLFAAGRDVRQSLAAATIGLFALGLLVVTLVTAVYAHLQSRTRTHARRLEAANAKLQHQATMRADQSAESSARHDRLGREIAHADGMATASACCCSTSIDSNW